MVGDDSLARRRAHHTLTWPSPCQCCTLHTHASTRCNHKQPAATLVPGLATTLLQDHMQAILSQTTVVQAGCVSMLMHDRGRGRGSEDSHPRHLDTRHQQRNGILQQPGVIAVNVRQHDTGRPWMECLSPRMRQSIITSTCTPSLPTKRDMCLCVKLQIRSLASNSAQNFCTNPYMCLHQDQMYIHMHMHICRERESTAVAKRNKG